MRHPSALTSSSSAAFPPKTSGANPRNLPQGQNQTQHTHELPPTMPSLVKTPVYVFYEEARAPQGYFLRMLLLLPQLLLKAAQNLRANSSNKSIYTPQDDKTRWASTSTVRPGSLVLSQSLPSRRGASRGEENIILRCQSNQKKSKRYRLYHTRSVWTPERNCSSTQK